MRSKWDIREILQKNAVTVMFVVLCIIGLICSGQTVSYVMYELFGRLSRNAFIVLALIIPIVAGMGINFAITIGAMAAQIAALWVIEWGISGLPGFLVAMLMTMPIAAFFGFLIGKLMNKMKGQEMIGGLILGYFANGLYQLLFLFIFGNLIPLKAPGLVIKGSTGVANTIDLSTDRGFKYALDGLLRVSFSTAVLIICGIIAVGAMVLFARKKMEKKKAFTYAGICARLSDNAQEQKYLRKTITGILRSATGMADFADKLKTAGIETKVKKSTEQVLYRSTALDGAWVPEDALGSEFSSEGIEYALKNGKMQLSDGAENSLLDRYQKLTIQYPEVCTAAVKLSSRQILSAGKNGLVLQVHDDNGNPAKLMVNKSEVTTSPDGEITFNVGNDFSYDLVYEDGTHGTIRGAKLIQQIDEENNVKPLAVVLTEDQIKTMSLRGVTIALPSKGIERLFIPEKYVVRNAANGQCAVSLYPNHQYSYIPTSGENKRNSIQGNQLAAILGVAINPSTENTTLSRRIAAVERRMGIENAKNLGKILLGMTSENMYTAADYDKAILSLGKKQIGLTNKISAMQEKRKEVAAVTKSLQICKTYKPVWIQYVELPMSQKSAFYSGHSTELQAYSSAAKNLEKEGIDQSVDLDKAIGFTEQLERKIEEAKEQLRETNSEEKKAQQERKKVLDIQENHTMS